jgi:hypothetical protein
MIVVVAVPPTGVPAHVASVLADVARAQEMVVVCGYAGATALLSAFRSELPRFDIVGIVVDPPTRVEGDLIDSLLEEGTLPVAFTAEHRVCDVVAWLVGRLDGAMDWTAAERLSAVAN